MTPAQASGHPNFVTDVATQGPTDPGMRAADCWFAQNRIPKNPACVDCTGQTPMTHSNYLGERISFGGTGALAAAGDPSVWDKITPEQQMWVGATLVKLNDLIVKATKTTCPDFGSTVNASLKCFQYWFNAGPKGAITKADGSKLLLRTDGYLDQETLDTLIAVTKLTANVKNFPTPFPATPTAIEKKGLSTGAMVGIGVAGATVLGGIIYAATRGKKARRSRRK